MTPDQPICVGCYSSPSRCICSQTEGQEQGGLKYDSEKPPVDLVPSAAILEIAKVLEFGSKKYAKWNWAKGINYTRLLAAAMRHILAYKEGEDKDAESNLSHIAHACCCLSFLLSFESRGLVHLDDRPKLEKK
jgi:hypothetical protein